MTTESTTDFQPETTTTTGGFNFNEALSMEYKDNPSITKFGGDVNVISTPNKRFTVTYILTIPLASIY